MIERITAADIAQMRANGYCRTTIAAAEAQLETCRRADEVIALIDRAFDGVTLDDGIGLRESDGIDVYAGADELKRLRALDEKLDWRMIPSDLLNYCHAAPSYLDSAGMLFHIPAFLTSELKGEYQFEFISRLIDGHYSATDFLQRLTTAQREAIAECVRFYCSVSPRIYGEDSIAAAIARFRGAE